MLGYALLATGLTFAARLGVYEGMGGKNIVVAVIILVMAYRGVRATFVYHASLNSRVDWKHDGIVGGIATISSIIVFIVNVVAAIRTQRLGMKLTDDEAGRYVVAPLMVVLTAIFIFCRAISPYSSAIKCQGPLHPHSSLIARTVAAVEVSIM